MLNILHLLGLIYYIHLHDMCALNAVHTLCLVWAYVLFVFFELQTLCICIHILCLSHKFACYLHITVNSTHVQMTLLPLLFPKPQYCPLQDDLLHFAPA